MSCDFPEHLISAWMDGEAGRRADEVARHVGTCPHCGAMADSWRKEGQALRELIDGGVGEVETLPALAKIRQRVADSDERSFGEKLAAFWHDQWAYNRRKVAGVVVAAALGALSAPAVVLWAAHAAQDGSHGARLASVVIESLQTEPNTQTVVYRGEDGSTTLIWVEPDANGETP